MFSNGLTYRASTDRDLCAFDADHELPAEVVNLWPDQPRDHSVVCNEQCLSDLTDRQTANL